MNTNIGEINETWKEIPGYGGKYFISNLGSVKLINNVRQSKSKYYKLAFTEKPLKASHLKIGYGSGYLCVRLTCLDPKKANSFYLHRLLAIAFIPNPENKPQVNHKNGNGLDNRIENLEWATAKENINHAWDNGLVKWTKTRISEDVKAKIIELNRSGLNGSRIAKSLNISQAAVQKLLKKTKIAL